MPRPRTPGAGITGAERDQAWQQDRPFRSPGRPTAQALPPALRALRRQRVAERLHRLGARALAEFIAELGPHAEHLGAEYARRLTPAMLAATGGDHFPPRQLDEVA